MPENAFLEKSCKNLHGIGGSHTPVRLPTAGAPPQTLCWLII